LNYPNWPSWDISQILAYTQQRYGELQRATYRDLIFKAIHTIAANPALGHTRPDIPPIYRAFNCKKHVMVYLKKEETIFIARILHGSMDFSNQV